MDSLYAFSKKHDFTSFQSVYGCLSVHKHNISPCFYNRCLSQLSLPTSKLLFFTRTRVNLRNTIVYGDIKIYRRNVKTLRFLEKLRSASAMHFALQLVNQATDRFHFFLPHNYTLVYWFPVLSRFS